MKATLNIHKGDFAIFPNLEKVVRGFNGIKLFRITNETENWVHVEWETELGATSSVQMSNLDFLNPYRQADRLTQGKNIILA